MMKQRYAAKISALLAAAMLGGSMLPVCAEEVTLPSAALGDVSVADETEQATNTVKISANYYAEENNQYTVQFTALSAIPAFTKLEARVTYKDASVISAAFDSAVLKDAVKDVLRGEDYASYTLQYETAAEIKEKTRIFSLTVRSEKAPDDQNLVLSAIAVTQADGTVTQLTPDMTIQSGPIVPELNEDETAAYDALIALPVADTLSFYQKDGALTDLDALQSTVQKATEKYTALPAKSRENINAVMEYNGYRIDNAERLTAIVKGMNNALGAIEIASVLKDLTEKTVMNYQFLLDVFQKKKDYINLGSLPKDSAPLTEVQETLQALESASALLKTAYAAASYADKAYACEDQIGVIQGLSAHKYYADYLSSLNTQIDTLTKEVTDQYTGRDKENILSILGKSKTTIEMIEKGMNDLPIMTVGTISIRNTYTVSFTRKSALSDSLTVKIVVTVKDKNGTVLDTAEKEFPADQNALNINILARSTYPKNEYVTVSAVYLVNGAEFPIDSKECKAMYFASADTPGGIGRPSNGGGSSSGGTKDNDNKGGGTLFPGASDEPETPSQDTEDQELFRDLGNHAWAKDAIEKLYYAGIVNGMEKDIFQPAGQVTREQFANMVTQLFGLSTKATKTNFKDVDENAWYAPYITAALQAGYIQGQSEEYFGIGEPIMRQDMATILYRALGNQNSKAVLSFTDQDSIAAYATDAIAELVGLGIVNGYEDGSFQPRGTATRAEAAKMIYGIYTYLNKE